MDLKGSVFLFARQGLNLVPRAYGGEQEEKDEPEQRMLLLSLDFMKL